jgi:hypothetical protein
MIDTPSTALRARPPAYNVTINLKTAKNFGLAISPTLLARAELRQEGEN